MKNHRQCSAHLNILFLLAETTEGPTPLGCISLTLCSLPLLTSLGAKVGIQEKR